MDMLSIVFVLTVIAVVVAGYFVMRPEKKTISCWGSLGFKRKWPATLEGVTGQGQESEKQVYSDPIARLRYSTKRRSFLQPLRHQEGSSRRLVK